MDTRLRGDNHADTRERNTRLVLRALTTYGPLSRRQISELSGLAPGTITGLVSHLIEQGMLVTVGTDRRAGSKGGPSRALLDFNPQGVAVLGIALGVFGRAVNLIGPHGETRGHAYSLDYSARTTIDEQIDWITDTASRLIDESDIAPSAIVGAGVGAEGTVNPQHGAESLVPYGSWQEYPLGRELERRLGMPVIAASACHADATGEILFGHGRTVDQLLCVSIGTTIGAAAIVHQEVLRGHHNLAGAIGHVVVRPDGATCVCGKRGCLETVAGVQAIRAAGQDAVRAGLSKRMSALCEGVAGELTSELVAQAAGDGDPAAVGIIKEAATAVAQVIAPLVSALGPELIVLQGEVPRLASSVFVETMMATLATTSVVPRSASPRIVTSSILLPPGTALGAAALALDRFFFSPQLAQRGRTTGELAARR